MTDIPSFSSTSSNSGSCCSKGRLLLLSNASDQSVCSSQKPSPSPSPFSFLCISSLKLQPSHVSTIAVSSTSNLLYSASSNQISVWCLTSVSELSSFNGSTSGSVKSLAFSNCRLFTAHQDGKIRVWEMTSSKRSCHRLFAFLPTVGDHLRHAIFPGNCVRVRRHWRRLWIEHADAVSALAAANGLLYSVSWDRSLKIWRDSDLRCLESVGPSHDDAVNAVAVPGDGTVDTGLADRRIRVWGKGFGAKRHSLIATLEKHRSSVNALALSEDGSVLYSGAKDRSIAAWGRMEGSDRMGVIGEMVGHGGAVLCLISVGDLLFSGSEDRTVRIWSRGEETRVSGCVGVSEGHEGVVNSLAAAGDGKRGSFVVCSGSLDGEIKVWEIWGPQINVSNDDHQDGQRL